MLPIDLGADGIFSGVEVREKEVPAGVFHVADDAGGRVDAAIVAHEVDDARLVHGDFPRMGEAGLQRGFHFRSWPGIFGIPALLCLPENPMSSTEKLKPGLKGAADLVV